MSILFCLVMPLQAAPVLVDIRELIEAGQYKKALTQLDNLLVKDKQQAHYLFHRARALEGMGQLDKAVAQYLALIKAHPLLPEPYNNLAVFYLRQGQTEKAQTLLNQAMKTHSGYARVYKNLMAVNAAQAREAYAKALQMPTVSQTKGIEVAKQLSLVDKSVSAAQTKSVVVAVTSSPSKPGLTYQVKGDNADKRVERAEKKQPVDHVHSDAIKRVLLGWAKAWTTKDVEAYLHFYSADYSPAGMSRHTWVQQRKERIKRPKWIRVSLRNFEVMEDDAAHLRVRLEQEYEADNYRDVTRKEFIMQQLEGDWRIIKERGLGYIVR